MEFRVFWFWAMKIEELDVDDVECDGDDGVLGRQIVSVDAKRALVGAGARILFYPTLLYNVLRNKIESEFRWWDEVDQVFFFFFKFYFLNLLMFRLCLVAEKGLEKAKKLGI